MDASLRLVPVSLPGQTEPRLRQLVSCRLGDCEGRPPREAVVRITLLREAAVLLSLRSNTLVLSALH